MASLYHAAGNVRVAVDALENLPTARFYARMRVLLSAAAAAV